MVTGTRYRGLGGCSKNSYAPGLLSHYFPGDRIVRAPRYDNFGDAFSSLGLAPHPYPSPE